MLSGEGNAGERWKTTIGLISKKTTLHVQRTFFYSSLPLFCTTTTRNFQKRYYGGNVVRVLVHFFLFHCHSFSPCIVGRFFSLPLIFSLHCWPLAFSFCHHRYKIFILFFQQKKVSFVFFSHSRSLSRFFSLSFAGLPPTLSFSLSFSCSIFQICMWTWQLI